MTRSIAGGQINADRIRILIYDNGREVLYEECFDTFEEAGPWIDRIMQADEAASMVVTEKVT